MSEGFSVKVPTKFVSPLNNEQTKILNNLVKNDSSWQVRMRAHSILLSSRKLSIDEIASSYNVHRNSVSSWIDAWSKSGVEGLRDLPRSGGPPKLTKAEKEVAIKLIKEQPRSPKRVLAKLAEQTGKDISISSLKRIAKSAKMSWKRVRKSLKSKRDEKEFKKAKNEITELKEQQLAGKIDLFYFDESGFTLDPSVPYAWQLIGEHIEIPKAKSKRLNVLGFLNAKDNQLESFCFECIVDTRVVVRCFNEFSKKVSKKTIILIDNASIHTSDEFLENIEGWEKNGLFIKYLPSYSPELNLIEILWRFIKYSWLPFSAYTSFKSLVNEVENILRQFGSEYKIAFA